MNAALAESQISQIRLCLAKKDYVRAEIVSNKVNVKVLNEEKHQVNLSIEMVFCKTGLMQDLKLRFYNLMIEYHSHYNNYFNICKAYKEIYSTPDVQKDDKQWRAVRERTSLAALAEPRLCSRELAIQALHKAMLFMALSPWDAEISDLLHR